MHPMENNFATNIDNDQLSLLPVCAFRGKIVVVDDPEAAEAACADLLSHAVIGFDTETRPTFRPGALNKVALLQLSTPETGYLFRLCKMPLVKPVIKVLESEDTLKVGADIKNDIRALQELRRFKPKGFADLQGMVAEWGIADKSVRKMAGIIMGVRVSKAQRLSNWEAATLTPAQQMYAVTDAWVCERMYGVLMRTDKRPLPMPEPVAGEPEKAGPSTERKRRRRPRRKIAKPEGSTGKE